MAKTASQMRAYRQAQAAKKQQLQAQSQGASEQQPAKKTLKAYEAVSTVKRGETYQIFVYENGKMTPYKDKKGNPQYRTGEHISSKMVYNKNREGWESKSQLEEKKKNRDKKIRKYIVRRVR